MAMSEIAKQISQKKRLLLTEGQDESVRGGDGNLNCG